MKMTVLYNKRLAHPKKKLSFPHPNDILVSVDRYFEKCG